MPPTHMRMTKFKDRVYLIVGKTSPNYLISTVLPQVWVIPYVTLHLAQQPVLLGFPKARWELTPDKVVDDIREPWFETCKCENLFDEKLDLCFWAGCARAHFWTLARQWKVVGLRRDCARALMLTLERAGVIDLSVMAAAARRAAELSSIGDEDRASRAIAQFQGLLAIVSRAGARGTLDSRAVTSLVASGRAERAQSEEEASASASR